MATQQPLGSFMPALEHFLLYLRARWRILPLLAVIFLGLSWHNLYTAPRFFTVEMVLGQVEPTQQAPRPKAGGADGALMAQLVPEQATMVDKFMNIITTNFFAERLEQNHDMVKQVFAGQWDAEREEWVRPTSLKSRLRALLFGAVGLESWHPPTAHELSTYIQNSIIVVYESKSGYLTLAMETPAPQLALTLLAAVQEEANALLRDQEIKATQAGIAYLKNRIPYVGDILQKRLLDSLLADYEYRLFLAESDVPFATEVISPPRASDLPTSPSFTKTVMFVFFMTFGLGFLWLWVGFLQKGRQACQA